MPNNYAKWGEEQKNKWNKYNSNYAKTHFKSLNIKLRLVEDKDMIEFLESQHETISDFVRGLIREKMNNSK